MPDVNGACLAKTFSRDLYLVFTIPPRLTFWTYDYDKPLIFATTVPIIRRTIWKGPWVIRGSFLSGMCQTFM